MASGKPRRRAVAERPVTPPAIRYIETSALLAAFLENDRTARQAIELPGRRVTSALTVAEAHRAVRRGRHAGRLTVDDERAIIRGLETFARRCELVAVSDEVLDRAGRPFPVEPVRTLDAIHLATLDLLGETPPLVTVVTRDRRIEDNARALGYVMEIGAA